MGSSIDECMRKFFYRHVAGITPIEEPDYFVSGRAWDAALGEWFKDGEPRERYAAALAKIKTTYDTSSCRIPRENRSREQIIKLFSKFVTDHVEPSYKVLRSNVAFKLPFSDFNLGGEMDQYAHWPKYGVVVHENKTTTIIPGSKQFPPYVDGFTVGQYANQVTHYVWAAMQLTEDVWGARILVACLDIPKRESTERKLFESIWLHHSPNRLQDYLDLCRYRMARVRNSWKSWMWPKEGQKCAGAWMFGRCEYYPLCAMHYSLENLEVPETMYKVDVPWAPWDGVKGD